MFYPSLIFLPPWRNLWTPCKWDGRPHLDPSPSSKLAPATSGQPPTITISLVRREIARIRVAGKKRKSIPTKKGFAKAECKLQRQAGEKEKKILQNFPGFCAIASSFRLLLISRMDCLNSSRFTFPSWSTSVSFSQEFTYKWKSGQWTGKALFKMVSLWPMIIFINMQSTHTVNKRFKCSLIPYTIQGGRR